MLLTESHALRRLGEVLFKEKVMTEQIDASCISVCETVCHFIERWLHVHPFTISALSFIVATSAFFAWTLNVESPTPLFTFCAFILVLVALTNLWLTPKFIRDNYVLLTRGLANPLKCDPKMQGARVVASSFVLIITLCSALLTFEYFVFPMIVAVAIWLCAHFRSCDPLPPNRKAERSRLLSQISRPRRT